MAPVSGDDSQQQGANRDELIHISFSFVTDTWLGRLKVAELVISLICGACASSVWSSCPSRFGFLNFVAWTAFINVLIDLILRISGLWDRLYWIFRHPALMLALCALACFAFLIGSSLAASCAYNDSTASASAVFGFFCLALFAVDTFIHFKKYRSMEAEARRQSSEEKAEPSAVI